MEDIKSPEAVKAARHICEEARVLLCTLRGGPPAVARGNLTQDLRELRSIIKARFFSESAASYLPAGDGRNDAGSNIPHDDPPPTLVSEEEEESFAETPTSPPRASKYCSYKLDMSSAEQAPPRLPRQPQDVGVFARPFLAVVMDPRAAGPLTLVALRALHRLLEQRSLGSTHFPATLEPLMLGVLACKFEQTDAGADEAVEMAIADLLKLLVHLNHEQPPPATTTTSSSTTSLSTENNKRQKVHPETLMEAFNTVFVTRNTFVHSPALCYHFEDILGDMVRTTFREEETAAIPRLILEFLVTQLLHTPLFADGEAQAAHEATRILCLRLLRTCLTTQGPWWPPAHNSKNMTYEQRLFLHILQDDLCLSLLMTGQAMWTPAYTDDATGLSSSRHDPPPVSMEVLSEICATMSLLWNFESLRIHLSTQFEAIFSGFYQRSLALLRQRPNPTDSQSFHANLVFDGQVENILESLVDILCLHRNYSSEYSEKDQGALETLFSTYDCHMSRSDVATGLVTELALCCGVNSTDNDNGNNGDEGGSSGAEPESVTERRAVPAHLKELCGEALVGAIQCLFQDANTVSNITDITKRALDAPLDPSSLRYIRSQKLLMRRAAILFNEKSSKGIEFLVSNGLIPDPATPLSVAKFLRNGIVVGLDKPAVGEYLGSVGKAPIAGKSPPCWERDWFHKEVLSQYCGLFRFEKQSLLDGLRMFLAAFRLPGEAQQIDRILQAFSDSCGRHCDESINGSLKIFSEDEKRASDAAYLLSFSIIMLNTDQHNDNIREDRKMKMEDFVRNNTDYGADITEKGKELPREFLEGIYESIREEEIRTEGEGADGVMTVERWKDVLRGSTREDEAGAMEILSITQDAEELKELVVENTYPALLSAIGAFWNVDNWRQGSYSGGLEPSAAHSGLLGAQGARLGMNLVTELLAGVRNVGRIDIFQEIFRNVCDFTGLIGYRDRDVPDAVEQTSFFTNSVEAQSAVIVAIQTARDSGDIIGVEGWKRTWAILFELRDLKMLGGGTGSRVRSILMETDEDMLSENERREWNLQLMKGIYGRDGGDQSDSASGGGLLGVFGRALFGSSSEPVPVETQPNSPGGAVDGGSELIPTPHRKEELFLWDDIAPSDDEQEDDDDESASQGSNFWGASIGAAFERQLIHEGEIDHQLPEMPVTGLERIEDTKQFHWSPRARVRKRLAKGCDFSGLVSDSRFLDDEGISTLLKALIDLIEDAEETFKENSKVAAGAERTKVSLAGSDGKTPAKQRFSVSPASEAFAEVLLCEIALKNRDRFGSLWNKILSTHYHQRLGNENVSTSPETGSSLLQQQQQSALMTPGLEKCVSGLLRLCCFAVQREELANDVLGSLKYLYSPLGGLKLSTMHMNLDKHLGEGLWRICRNVDGLRYNSLEGWDGLFGLIEHCAAKGVQAQPAGRGARLSEDDPALHAYRSLHIMLHAAEIKDIVPFGVVRGICALIEGGDRNNSPKLCMAGLDLLLVLHHRLESLIAQDNPGAASSELVRSASGDHVVGMSEAAIWITCWMPVLEGMAAGAGKSSLAGVRQHALSMLTDAVIDRHGRSIPDDQLCDILNRICMPVAEQRIAYLTSFEEGDERNWEQVMIELELCVSLVFKPFLHHLKNILTQEEKLLELWKSLLNIVSKLVGETGADAFGAKAKTVHGTYHKLLMTTKELATEHLRNAIMVLIACGVLKEDSSSKDDISSATWDAVDKMDVSKESLKEWKRSVSGGKGGVLSESQEVDGFVQISKGGEDTCEVQVGV